MREMLKLGTVGGADYAITGGFFIATQLVLLVLLYPSFSIEETKSISTIISSQIGGLPSEVRPALVSLLVALSLLSVFFFGLLIDLMGSLFVFWELNWFLRHLQRNKDWLSKLVNDNFVEYIGNDFEILSRIIPYNSLDNLRFWKKRAWGFYLIRDAKSFEPSYRLQLILISYVFGSDHKARIELLQKRIKLYEISRSITTTLMLSSLQIIAAFILYAVHQLLIIYAIIWIFTGLSLFITYRSYSRFSAALFALVYIQMKLEAGSEKAEASSTSSA
jgi:hypothetical protein